MEKVYFGFFFMFLLGDSLFFKTLVGGQWPIPSIRCAYRNERRCIYLLGLDIRFDKYNCHDSLQMRLIEGLAI